MEIKQGDIYLYQPPKQDAGEQTALLSTSGPEQDGLRPYIVVSRSAIHINKPTVVGVPLTSRMHKANSYRIALPQKELIRDIESAFEFRDSVAMCDHVRVLDASKLVRRIGRASQKAQLAIELGLAYIFEVR